MLSKIRKCNLLSYFFIFQISFSWQSKKEIPQWPKQFVPYKPIPVKTRRGVGLVNSVPETTLTDITLTDLEFGH